MFNFDIVSSLLHAEMLIFTSQNIQTTFKTRKIAYIYFVTEAHASMSFSFYFVSYFYCYFLHLLSLSFDSTLSILLFLSFQREWMSLSLSPFIFYLIFSLKYLIRIQHLIDSLENTQALWISLNYQILFSTCTFAL